MERSLFLRFVVQNDIRRNVSITMFSLVTSDKHVPLKNVGGHGTVHFFETKKKGRDARPKGSGVTRRLEVYSRAVAARAQRPLCVVKTVGP